MTIETVRRRRGLRPDTLRILDGIPLGIIVIDGQGGIQGVNACAAVMLQRTGLAMPLHHVRDLFPGGLGGLWGGQQPPAGTGEISTRRIGLGALRVELSCSPRAAEKDRCPGFVFTLRDVTETEREQAREKHSETTAVMEKWSARMAHEIRNPLGSIELFASLLKKDLKRKKDIGRIDQVIEAARNVEKKIAALILAGKSFQAPVEDVNIHDVLKDIMLFSERIIDQESVYLSVRYAAIQPLIECNAELIRQVFLNLMIKALQEIPEPGRLDIETRYLPECRAIEIHFIDNSPAARESVRFSLFDSPVPPRGNSAGLDLAIVHNIVNLYRGTIRIEYVEGVGTAFIIAFPVKAAAAEIGAAAGRPCEPR
jgi:nitrogen-specific signal transduction histidine kinase